MMSLLSDACLNDCLKSQQLQIGTGARAEKIRTYNYKVNDQNLVPTRLISPTKDILSSETGFCIMDIYVSL